MRIMAMLLPILFALIPVLFYYAGKEMISHPFHVVIFPALCTVSFAVFTFVIALFLRRDFVKAALNSATALIALFVSPLIIVGTLAMSGGKLGVGALEVLEFLGPCLLVAAGFIIGMMTQRKMILTALFWSGLFVFAVNCAVLGSFVYQTYCVQLPQCKLPEIAEGKVTYADKPDIYFIILDAYASPETFRTTFGYDNSAFTGSLEKSGFLVHRDTFSNYPMTEMSLCATLNMDYDDRFGKVLGAHSDSLGPVYASIAENRVMKLAQKSGYRFVLMDSRFGPTSWWADADANISSGYMDMFTFEFSNMTLIGMLDHALKTHWLADYYRHCLRSQFVALPAVAREEAGPKFVFCHFICPHPPFLFGAKGQAQNTLESFSWPPPIPIEREMYVNQAKFVESQVSQFVPAILQDYASKGKKRPIIIIQSDHGPAFGPVHGTDRDSEFLYHRQRIFNAMLLPDDLRAAVPPQFSPVNDFRFLFSQLFACDLPLLPNRSFYCTYARPFDQLETTKVYAK